MKRVGASELTEPAFAARALLLDTGSRNGTRALAREILMMDAADHEAAFEGLAIKQAKLWMLQRNACVVLGNIGTEEDLAVLASLRRQGCSAGAVPSRLRRDRRAYRRTVGSREGRGDREGTRRRATATLRLSRAARRHASRGSHGPVRQLFTVKHLRFLSLFT